MLRLNALTLDQLIEELTDLRRRVPGDVPVYAVDKHQTTSIVWHTQGGIPEQRVYLWVRPESEVIPAPETTK
jgi:hypothetical protein